MRRRHKDPRRLLNSAIHAMKNKKYNRAKKKFEQIFDLNSELNDSASIWSYYGVALVNLNDHKKALNAFTKATKLDRGNGDYWMQKGIVEEQLQKVKHAHTSYYRALKYDPDDENKLLALSRVTEKLKSKQDALNLLQRYLKRFKKSPKVLLRIAGLFFELEKKEEGESFLKQHAFQVSTSDLAVALGNHHLQKGDFQQAQEIFEESLQHYPNDINSRYGLGLSLQAQKKFKPAIQQYKKVADAEKPTQELFLNLAKCLAEIGEISTAIDHLYSSRKFPNTPLETNLLLARLLIKDERPDKAKRILKDEQNRHEDNHLISFYLGLIALMEKDLKQAQYYFQKSLDNNDEFLPSLVQLAKIDLQSNQLEAAFEKVKKSLRLNPTYKDAFILGTKILYHTERWDELKNMMKEYLTKQPTDLGVIKNYYEICKEIGCTEEDKTFIRDLKENYVQITEYLSKENLNFEQLST